MFRMRTLVTALVVFVSLGAFMVPTSFGQDGGNNFEGTWLLSLNFNPPGMDVGAPTFTYGVIAENTPGFKSDQGGPQPLTTEGGGSVIGACEFGPGARANGMSFRLTPLSGDPATGLSLTFEVPSGRSPSTIVLRGDFSADGNTIEGLAFFVGDAEEAFANADVGTFTLQRVEQLQCGLVSVP